MGELGGVSSKQLFGVVESKIPLDFRNADIKTGTGKFILEVKMLLELFMRSLLEYEIAGCKLGCVYGAEDSVDRLLDILRSMGRMTSVGLLVVFLLTVSEAVRFHGLSCEERFGGQSLPLLSWTLTQ